MPAVGDLIEVEIEKLVAGGEGLGRSGGIVVFVRPAYPGDRVRVRVTESRKKFVRGVVEALIVPGPGRRSEPCPVAESCGGCDWTSYRLDAQIRAKREILLESLRRIGKLDDSQIPAIGMHASPLNYRLRSRLHVSEEGLAGFYEFRSHRVVPIVPECEVVGPLLQQRIAQGTLSGEPGSEISFLENERELIRSDTIPADREASLEITIRGHRFEVDVNSFFQVNRHLLGTLMGIVEQRIDTMTRTERALDLYGGSGFFSIPLANRFSTVISVENDRVSHDLAMKNSKGLRLTAIQSDVLDFLRQETEKPDLILLDPPRSGAHPDVISHIDRLDPELVSYLSCDPVNLARDLERFRRRGWSLQTVDLIDLFPNTHHIETLVSIRRP